MLLLTIPVSANCLYIPMTCSSSSPMSPDAPFVTPFDTPFWLGALSSSPDSHVSISTSESCRPPPVSPPPPRFEPLIAELTRFKTSSWSSGEARLLPAIVDCCGGVLVVVGSVGVDIALEEADDDDDDDDVDEVDVVDDEWCIVPGTFVVGFVPCCCCWCEDGEEEEDKVLGGRIWDEDAWVREEESRCIGDIFGLVFALVWWDRGLRRPRLAPPTRTSLSVPFTISMNCRHLSMNMRLGWRSSRPGYSCCVVSMASPIRPANTSRWISAT